MTITITEIQKNCFEYYNQNKEFISTIVLIVVSSFLLTSFFDNIKNIRRK